MKSLNLIILWIMSTIILSLSTNSFDTMNSSSNTLVLSLLIYLMDLLYLAITFLVFKFIYLNFSNPYLKQINNKRRMDINI